MKKVGIALSGGGARGFAHIGVLQELEKEGIYPDFVAGTSMGAIIGSLYCSGHTASEIEDLVESEDWKDALKLTFSKSGFVGGDKIRLFLSKLIKNDFDSLDRKFVCVATDVNTGKKIVLKEGNLVKAVYSSMAVPGIFTPLRYKGMVLVDGGLVEPVPAYQLKELGADCIITVDLSVRDDGSNIPSGEIFGFGKDFFNHFSGRWFNSDKFYGRFFKNYNLLDSPGFFSRLFEKVRCKVFGGRSSKVEGQNKMPNVIDIFSKTLNIMSNQIAAEQINNGPHDFIVRPELSEVSLIKKDVIANTIESGRKSAREVIPLLKEFKQHRSSH